MALDLCPKSSAGRGGNWPKLLFLKVNLKNDVFGCQLVKVRPVG